MPITRSFKGGRKTVTAAGTAEKLSSTSIPVHWVRITAEEDQEKSVAIGGSNLKAKAAERNGYPLAKGEDLELKDINLNQIYVDAETSGDGVTFIYSLSE